MAQKNLRLANIPQAVPANLPGGAKNAKEFLDDQGKNCWELMGVATDGPAGRRAIGALQRDVQRPQAWEYEYVQYSDRNPHIGAGRIDDLMQEGWQFAAIYSQGKVSHSILVCLKRRLRAEVQGSQDEEAEPNS